ncbi:MAG: hypothetical protein KGQ42_04490 [Alphaproteobacteria bacterium]|nr:hypothetical protein [Alphaproteobacteria bacterium]MDE2042270.1 hypothetical protein [Alphaproteobacteria bacterium]MDE2340507.1 hypothetical protein [Alphaproteobacteria bacterium]
MSETLMPFPAMDAIATPVPPAVLLGKHLRSLKRPTFAGEYEKVAMESAQDRADYPQAPAKQGGCHDVIKGGNRRGKSA